MLAVRQSPDMGTSLLFMDTAGAGPSTSSATASMSRMDREQSAPERETPSTPRKRATTSRSRSATPAADRKYKCLWEGCDKAYTKPSRLAEHELSHTGERRHACPHCDHTYLRANHLQAHLRTHLSEDDKAFACEREGCDKRFWTAAHLRRHEEVHDKAEVHECDQCDASFAKAHLLRDHAVTHMAPGTKPYPCTQEGCTWSFATKQKLKAHEKTHQVNRYTCSHPSHDQQPVFAKWSLLQSHIHQAHPPICPHVECHGRVFKNAQRLRDHLKVHDQRAEDLHALSMTPALESDDEDDEPKKRKRRKSSVSASVGDDGGKSPKLRRVQSGEAGKNYPCYEAGCDKRFKTSYALKTHHRVAHLKIRSFACPIEGCDKTYAHMSNLNQHIAAHNRAEEAAPLAILESAPIAVPEETTSANTDTNDAALLTGNVMAIKRYGCPASRVINHQFEGHARCNMRFWRVYDVRRHLKADHGLDLEDLELRQLLGDVDAAEQGLDAAQADYSGGSGINLMEYERDGGGATADNGDIPIDPELMNMT